MIHKLISKRDWYSIFVACLFLFLIVIFCFMGLIARIVIMSMIVLMGCISFYFAFIKKYDVSDEEFEGALASMKEEMFGGKKNE